MLVPFTSSNALTSEYLSAAQVLEKFGAAIKIPAGSNYVMTPIAILKRWQKTLLKPYLQIRLLALKDIPTTDSVISCFIAPNRHSATQLKISPPWPPCNYTEFARLNINGSPYSLPSVTELLALSAVSKKAAGLSAK